jgi:hypothetical protein
MTTDVWFRCNNSGLGDRLLDTIGFYVLCKFLHYEPYLKLNCAGEPQWGNYDERLFIFTGLHTTQSQSQLYIHSPNSSASLSPYKVYEHVKKFLPRTKFEEIAVEFSSAAKQIIKPSELISARIPLGIENAYGIHLRKSDKVSETGNPHLCTKTDFQLIHSKLIDTVVEIIMTEDKPTFFVVSEDKAWRQEIQDLIVNKIIVPNRNKATVLKPDYTNNGYENFESVLDMFCLSKCKTILQGVNFSAFSTVAALLGSNKLVNYSHHLNRYRYINCMIHLWTSVLEINSKPKSYDLAAHQRICASAKNLTTNITMTAPTAD